MRAGQKGFVRFSFKYPAPPVRQKMPPTCPSIAGWVELACSCQGQAWLARRAFPVRSWAAVGCAALAWPGGWLPEPRGIGPGKLLPGPPVLQRPLAKSCWQVGPFPSNLWLHRSPLAWLVRVVGLLAPAGLNQGNFCPGPGPGPGWLVFFGPRNLVPGPLGRSRAALGSAGLACQGGWPPGPRGTGPGKLLPGPRSCFFHSGGGL